MSNKLALLKKMKALAMRGVGEEKICAQNMLDRLMKKYGIEESQLEEDESKTFFFAYSQETECWLLVQIIYMVTGKSAYRCKGANSGRKLKKLSVECTALEKLEIESNYVFFKNALKEELQLFYIAFATTNNLFPDESKVPPFPEEDLSREERSKIVRAGLMASGMERRTLRKLLDFNGN